MSVSITLVAFLALSCGCCAQEQVDPNDPDRKLIDALTEFDKTLQEIRQRRQNYDPGSDRLPHFSTPWAEKELAITEDDRKRLAQAFQAVAPERIALFKAQSTWSRARFAEMAESRARLVEMAEPSQPRTRDSASRSSSSDEMAKLAAAIQRKEEEAIQGVLGPERFERYKQIQLQRSSPYVFVRGPRIAETLKLTKEQRSRIDAICLRVYRVESPPLFDPDEDSQAKWERIRREMDDFKRRSRLSLAEKMKEEKEQAEAQGLVLARLYREAWAEILALLTPEQMKAWQKLTGPPVDLGSP